MAAGDEIRQQLGFDAQQALDELDRLDKAFAGFGSQLATTVNRISYFNDNAGKVVAALKQMAAEANATLSSFANLASITPAGPAAGGGASGAFMAGQMAQAAQATAALNTLTTAANQAAQAIANAGNTAAQSISKAHEHTKSWTISWETLARVVMTQAIVRTMSMIREGIKESYEAFLDFSKRVGEIRTIDQDRSFAQIAADVRQLSDAFNQPLSRTAEAQYQVISDQFVTAADRANILTAANQLAKVSAEDLSASAQLLTGALNAYGESSESAGLRAAQFFESVNLGRFRIAELGTAMGRVQSIGHELGVSMEELQAALIAITIGGVKAAEGATQMRGILTALLKPSDAMKDAFHRVGIESGEAAVATWGLQGALEQLRKATDGSETAMAKLFPNVRGLAGGLRIVGEGAEKFEQAMRRLQQIDASVLRKRFEDFTSTDAERLTAELNKVANFFKAEFGAEVVHSLAKVSDAVGGGIVPALRIPERCINLDSQAAL